jgi:arylsulfatase A-like enzyme
MSVTEPTSPNVIFLMADDLGFGDVGFNGNEVIDTPNLDRMAADGMRFTRFYSIGPICSPTRASCLTGRHYMRFGMMNVNVGKIPEQEITAARICREAGYTTGHFGKWHVGSMSRTESVRKDPAGRYGPPWERDYDESFATELSCPTWNPASGRFPKHDSPYWHNGAKATANLAGDDSRVIMDRAIPFVERAVAGGTPFMATIWFHAPHSPVVAGPEYLERYAGHPEGARHFYGCITAMDEQIGRLRARLSELGVAEDTLIFFCSDNGPEGTGTPDPEYDAYGGAFYGTTGGFRGRKRFLYNGGVCVPAAAVWPGTIEAGRVETMPTSVLDYLPTLCAMVGRAAPGDRPLDGEDVLPMLTGRSHARRTPVPFATNTREPFTAWIHGDFKLLSNLAPDGQGDALYHVQDDPAEANDLSASEPDRVATMRAELLEWLRSCRKSYDGGDYQSAYEPQGSFLAVELPERW